MVVKSQDYAVKDTPIVLTVHIGDGQAGGTAVTLDGVPVSMRSPGLWTLGREGQNLRGSVAVCVTTVKDENPNTNHTSVTHVLTGGVAERRHLYETSVPADGATEIYVITYFLG